MANETPICVAIIVCNDLIEDKRTNNKSLIGLFNSITAPQLPATHPRMVVMASITNAKGDVPVRLELRAPSGHEILKAEGVVPTGDPLAVIDVVFELNGVRLEELGTHMIDVYTDGKHLISRRFQVIAGWSQHQN